jgi:hypothetical protein
MKPITRKAISGALILCLAAPVLPARAELIGAQATDRERIAAVLARDDMRAQLVSRGVDAAQAEARLAALTDAEAAQLAKDIDALPAGGNPVAALGMAAAVVVYAIALVATLIVMGAVATVKHARAQAAQSRSAQ